MRVIVRLAAVLGALPLGKSIDVTEPKADIGFDLAKISPVLEVAGCDNKKKLLSAAIRWLPTNYYILRRSFLRRRTNIRIRPGTRRR